VGVFTPSPVHFFTESMLRYILNRVLLTIPTLFGVALLVFFMLRLMPGDVVDVMLRGQGANVSQEVIEAERARLGLDKPIYVQFGRWMAGVLHGDLGYSMWTGNPISHEISLRLELSLQVAIMATLLALIIALPLGTLSALHKDKWIDQVIRVISISGLAIPSFWLGMIIIMLLLTYFHWNPPLTFTPFFDDPMTNLSQLVWPALAVGYRYSAVITRMMRSTLLEVLQEDYIRTARAKGVFERLVVIRHAMRNAMLPVITVTGLEFAFLIGGLVVTEQVFNLNGIGKLFVDAVSRADNTMVQGLVLLVAVCYILINLLVDLLYAVLDPRIRYR
jgi:peptide/nickel transport system permease protein